MDTALSLIFPESTEICFIHTKAFNHDQNTEICFEICCKLSLEFCSFHAPNGRRLSFENWFLISSKKSIKNADFPQNLFILWKYMIFHRDALNGTAFDWKNYSFSPKEALLQSGKKSLENAEFLWNLFILLKSRKFQWNTLNGTAFAWKNWYFHQKYLLWNQARNLLKSVHFVKIYNFVCNNTKR